MGKDGKRGDLIKDAQAGVPGKLIHTPTNVGGLGRKMHEGKSTASRAHVTHSKLGKGK